MTPPLHHNVAVRVGGRVIECWSSYSVELDMLNPADGFSMKILRAKRDVYDLVKPDTLVEILLDDTAVLTGFIDERDWTVSQEGTLIDINGRDKGGRLVDESAKLTSFRGIGIRDLAKALVSDWFPDVVLQNSRNRRLLRGKGAKNAKVSSEPPIIADVRFAKKVPPGDTIWQVLSNFLEEAELLAWSSGDGKELVIGLPNYKQDPQYRFFLPSENSDRQAEGNVVTMTVHDGVAERYSMITACGAGRGDSASYGPQVTKRRFTVRDGPNADGTGRSFQHPKRLIVSDDNMRDLKLAEKRAKREMAERDASGHHVKVTVKGHSQEWEGKHALYAVDSMALVEAEEIGLKGMYLVTAVTFTLSADAGEVTTLTLVPKGTVLK